MICMCGSHKIGDLTRGLGEKRNYYCPDCEARYYNDRWWTKKEWFEWVNN